MKLPDFFVIGAQKAGSTYLLQCLGEHPQIFMPLIEVPFLEQPGDLDGQLAEFAGRFADAPTGAVIGVKRANVLGRSESAVQMHRYMPQVKLITVLRHPLERTISGYFQYMASGLFPIIPPEKGLRGLLAGQFDSYPRSREIIDFSLYHKHLQQFAKFYARKQMHVVLLDDVKQNAANEVSQLYEFVGVDSGYRPTSIRGRPMAVSYSLTRLRLCQPLEHICLEPSLRRKARSYRSGFLAKAAKGLNTVIDRLLWQRLFPAGPPKLSLELATELMDLFRTDVDRLEAWLDRPLPAWKQLPESQK